MQEFDEFIRTTHAHDDRGVAVTRLEILAQGVNKLQQFGIEVRPKQNMEMLKKQLVNAVKNAGYSVADLRKLEAI